MDGGVDEDGGFVEVGRIDEDRGGAVVERIFAVPRPTLGGRWTEWRMQRPSQ